MKKEYKVATGIRGFLTESFDVINASQNEIQINYNSGRSFEKIGWKRNILHKMIGWKIFDYLGVFQIVSVNTGSDNYDGYISYNRFLDIDQPYIIIMENPYALVNYADERMEYSITKQKLEKLFNNEMLKGIICISKACRDTIGKIYKIPNSIKLYQAYPLVPDGCFDKEFDKGINCLFIAAEFYLKGGNEVIESFKKLRNRYTDKITLVIVTPVERLTEKTKCDIEKWGIILKDYKLSKAQMRDEYKKSHILLNPTRMESFSLVTLESMKFGCIYIGTDLYALPEMVVDGENGYLSKSIYSPWTQYNMFDHKKHKNLSKLSNPELIDYNLVEFIEEKVNTLILDRKLLKSMCRMAYLRSKNPEFSERENTQKWVSIISGQR